MYEIQSKSDFQMGATLVVRIPEEDLDAKALNTIQADHPAFLLPFRFRAIDGQIEFTYQAGSRSKLAYLSGDRSPQAYARLWQGLLQPLLDCDDWFLNPYGFVLDADYLYCDKNSGAISYLYIPTLKPCSDQQALKSMVTQVARNNHVSDMKLENQVVWAIQDFSITDFLAMLKPYELPEAPQPPQDTGPVPVPPPPPPKAPIPAKTPEPVKGPAPGKVPAPPEPQPIPSGGGVGDIVINLDGGIADKKPKGGLFAKKEKAEPKEKPPKPAKEKGGLFGKGKGKGEAEIIQGAGVSDPNPSDPGRPRPPEAPPPVSYDDGATELDDEAMQTGPRLRYVGSDDHPRLIAVSVEPGGIFTVGRFDASVNKQQSSFEFDKRTKAVSRRHAAIERGPQGYSILDLDSGAGTFLDGRKLPPNAPFQLRHGCRVSFGHLGADYVWEE